MTKHFSRAIATAAALTFGASLLAPAAFADQPSRGSAEAITVADLSRGDARDAALKFLNGDAGTKYRVGEITRAGNHWKVTVLNRAGLPVTQLKVHAETGEVTS